MAAPQSNKNMNILVDMVFSKRAISSLLCCVFVGAPTANLAKEANQAVCCRTSGGTRAACSGLWVGHMVPPNSRFQPGPQGLIGLLHQSSREEMLVVLQFRSLTGQVLGEARLPMHKAGLWLLKLPLQEDPAMKLPLVWESYPACRANEPPSQTLLESGTESRTSEAMNGIHELLAEQQKACGHTVATQPLLQAMQWGELASKFPSRLPVWCLKLKVSPLDASEEAGSGTTPRIDPKSR